jgi:catechol 2,3-dioxygenase-like lactoylglutathione lyase family enzyme
MFEHEKPYSGFAVDDTDKATRFYSEVLGLRVTEENGLLTLQLSDDTGVLIYPKPDHEPAGYTILNFPVADVAAAVDYLTAAGVEMERYDGVEQDDRGIALDSGPLIAWFKDPAGNVLSVLAAD